jgi:PIN domain nuclease of toxin-antitoxin system
VIVLDTHVIIWDALKPKLLSDPARQAIDRANRQDGIIFCDISLWEIAMLMHKGRLQIEVAYPDFINLVLQANQYMVRSITPAIAHRSTQLPATVNADPADRLIAATALVENAVLVTADENLRQAAAIPTLW